MNVSIASGGTGTLRTIPSKKSSRPYEDFDKAEKIKTDWIFKLDAITGGKAPVACGPGIFQADPTCTFDGSNKTRSEALFRCSRDFSLGD